MKACYSWSKQDTLRRKKSEFRVVRGIFNTHHNFFKVKGGGHIINLGFSSTTGVQISMYRFSEINYKPSTQTVDIGPGLIWDDVYAALAPLNVNVVGGRTTGVGVAGFTLGGGRQ